MKILMIDDSPYDRALIQRRVQKEFQDAEFVEVIRQSDLDEALAQQNFDLALTDYRLQWTNGLWLLHTIKARFPLLSVIMVTDTGSEEVATEGMKAGLSDYVLKKELHRLPLAIKESLAKANLLAEREVLAEQVRQAQKMESIGQLVSGIAHDFNNILAGILGYTDQSLSKVDTTHPVYEGLLRTRESTLRAAQMVRQLLAFSRHQVLEPAYVDVNDIVANLIDFIKKVIGEHIEIIFAPASGVQTVFADKVQLEQVVMNLCINARDAMSEGGQLRITIQRVALDEARQPTQTMGQTDIFVQLTVQDTGIGMDEKTRERIFEPFFTTKEVGKGTGLGLSTVHGIIGQHKGFITVESMLGKGTSFHVYLPFVEHMPIEVHQAVAVEPETQMGTETILLVEDDQDLRELMQDVLEECGYTVISASNGEEGLHLLESVAMPVELIVSDMMTPKLGGKDLYKKLAQSGSTPKFLFMSGYLPEHLDQDFHVERETHFLQKPFDLDELTRKVRLALKE
jgi:signal transduction histidine kinase